MDWRRDEVWLDTDVLWFREQPRRPFGALAPAMPAFAAPGWALDAPVATGLEASRRRRLAKEAARKRRLTTRTVPAVALVVGSAAMVPQLMLRSGDRGPMTRPLQEDPPSLTFRLDPAALELPGAIASRKAVASPRRQPAAQATQAAEMPTVEWRRATSVGLPFAGHLVDGTQLPVEGPDWVTWNPVTDSAPNQPHRLYGHDRTIEAILSVAAAHRAAHPEAPRLVIGDISLRGGGPIDEHASHENGLDVDVYYPRLDGRLRAPTSTAQVDRVLAQDILDRFLAAGAKVVFVGYSTGLRGPSDVVVPYPRHENHMHVRFPNPAG